MVSIPNSTTLVVASYTTDYGRPVRGSRRSLLHLEFTREKLAESHPGCSLVIIQSAYNTGVPESAGTHDYDACYDVKIIGMDWWDAQSFLRACGWAAWYRMTPTFSLAHIHMVSLGYTTRVGEYVPGQVTDYYNHRTGLVGHYSDSSWHPSSIASTIFDYTAYYTEKHMRLRDQLAKIAEDKDVSMVWIARIALVVAVEKNSASGAKASGAAKVKIATKVAALRAANKLLSPYGTPPGEK